MPHPLVIEIKFPLRGGAQRTLRKHKGHDRVLCGPLCSLCSMAVGQKFNPLFYR